jgi:hypothetical protein
MTTQRAKRSITQMAKALQIDDFANRYNYRGAALSAWALWVVVRTTAEELRTKEIEEEAAWVEFCVSNDRWKVKVPTWVQQCNDMGRPGMGVHCQGPDGVWVKVSLGAHRSVMCRESEG